MRYGRLAPIAAFALIVLLLGSGLPHAQSPAQPACGTSPQSVCCALTHGQPASISTCIADTIPLSAIGILISLMIVALSYMLGEIFGLQGLKGWYKTELWETIKSAMLVGSILSVLVISSGIAAALVGIQPSFQGGSNGNTAISSNLAGSGTIAGLYAATLNGYVNPELASTYNSISGMIGLQSGINSVKSVRISTWAPLPIPIPLGPATLFLALQFGSTVPIYTTSYIAAYNTVAGIDLGPTASFVITILNFVVVPALLVLQMQSSMFYLIVYLGFGFFLPAGIIMRSIPFIRGIGGTMIGIGLAVSIVYPVLLLAINMPITNYVHGIFQGNAPTPPSSACDLGSGPIAAVGCAFLTLSGDIITGAYHLAPGGAPAPTAVLIGTQAAQATSQYFNLGYAIGYWGSLNSIVPALNFVTYDTFDTLVQVILMVFDFVLGMVIANTIASLLGGKVRLGIGKIKLA